MQINLKIKDQESFDPEPRNKHFGLICFWMCGKAFLLILLLVITAAVYGGYRLHKEPVSLKFAENYLRGALAQSDLLGDASFGDAVLYWPELDKSIYLGLRDVQLYNDEKLLLLDVKQVFLSLSNVGLLKGRIIPKGLIVEEPVLKVTRAPDGSLGVGFGSNQFAVGAKNEKTSEMVLGERLYDSIARALFNENTNDAPERYEIRDAYVIYDDAIWGMALTIPDADFEITAGSGSGISLNAAVNFSMPQNNINRPPALNLRFLLKDKGKSIDAVINTNKFDPTLILSQKPAFREFQQIDAKLDMNASISFDQYLKMQSFKAEMQIPNGVLVNRNWYDRAVEFSDVDIEMAYDADESLLSISRLQARMQNDFEIKADAALGLDSLSSINDIKLSAQIDAASTNVLTSLFPNTMKGTPIHLWGTQKVRGGRLQNIKADAGFAYDAAEEKFALNALDLRYDYEGVDVEYKDGMTPVTQSSGNIVVDYDAQNMLIKADQAMLGEMRVDGTVVTLSNIFTPGNGRADIDAPITGPLASLMNFIRQSAINVNHPFTAENNNEMAGQFDGVVRFSMPTTRDLKFSDIELSSEANLINVAVPNLFEGLDYKSDLNQFVIKDKALRISGRGMIAGRPVQSVYETFLNPSERAYNQRVKAQLKLDPNLRAALNIDLDQFISGSFDSDIQYTEFAQKKREITINADLTTVKLDIDPLNYHKPSGEEASANAKVLMNGDDVKRIEALRVLGPDLFIDKAVLNYGQGRLISGEMPILKVGFTDLGASFEQKSDGAYHILGEGPSLDLRPFLSTEKEEKDASSQVPLVVSLKADVMQTSDTRGITDTQIYAVIDDAGRVDQLEMDARAGEGDIYIRYKPDEEGIKNFRMESDDAGAMLRAFGLYENIQGGRLVIYGEPINDIYQRNLVGLAEISDFRIVRAPYLARIISGLSRNSINNLLEGEGIAFKKLEADFDWIFKPQGSVLVLKDGRTSGNALGLTFDGTFDNAASQIDLSGTIIPLTGVNTALGNIPVVGNLLGSGSGLFAATYKIKGSTAKDAPQDQAIKTSVNPLSVLAPGILRTILFE